MNSETSRRAAAEPVHSHIASLDGLRFIAAASVLASHGYFFIVLFENNALINGRNAPIVGLSTIGMTLFFVLSGFVIHYNYAATVPQPGGKRAFFVARFARLYPLFLAVFVIETVGAFIHADGKTDVLSPVPLYLTFTESWWFWVFGDHPATEAYSNASGLMWSLSTEAFFYAVYPLIAPALSRLAGWRLVAVWCIVAVLSAVVAYELTVYRGYLDNWVAIYTGNPRAAQNFAHWLVFNSPWMRIFEFLIGALTAQYVMTVRLRTTPALMASVLAIALIAYAYLYCNINLLPMGGAITTCVAGAFGVLMGASATRGQFVSRLLSSRLMVIGGEASYSLYLLHYWIMHNLGHWLGDRQNLPRRVALYLILMALSVVVSRITYLTYERPMIRIVRRWLSVRVRCEPHHEAPVSAVLPSPPKASAPPLL
jgi:peptidoglycan/LPS O-acetylase OafA/YrhL